MGLTSVIEIVFFTPLIFFVPLQLDCLRKYTTLLPGVAEVTQRLQKQGIKLGSTTGSISAILSIT